MTAKELRALRKRMGLTQQQLATLTRITRNSIARMESGRMTITGPMDLLLRFVEAGVEALDSQRSRRRAGSQRKHGAKARPTRGQGRTRQGATQIQKRGR